MTEREERNRDQKLRDKRRKRKRDESRSQNWSKHLGEAIKHLGPASNRLGLKSSLSSRVIPGKLLNFLKPQFPYLY